MPIRFATNTKPMGAIRPPRTRPAPQPAQSATPPLPTRKPVPIQVPPAAATGRKPESSKIKAQRAIVDELAKKHDAMLTDPKRTAGALTSLAVQLYQAQVKLSAMIQKG